MKSWIIKQAPKPYSLGFAWNPFNAINLHLKDLLSF